MSGDSLSIAVTGAGGRMGREVISAAADREGASPFQSRSTAPRPTPWGGSQSRTPDLDELLAAAEPDALVDFTGPESAVAYAEICADAGVAMVTGTTGFADAQLDGLRAAASKAVPVLKASNFARGVAPLRRAVREAAAALPGYDVELTETHHNAKRDAPRAPRSRSSTTWSLSATTSTSASTGEGRRAARVERIGVHAPTRGRRDRRARGAVRRQSRGGRAHSPRRRPRRVRRGGARRRRLARADREPGWYAFGDVLDAGAGE